MAIGTTVALVLVTEEIIEIYKDHKIKRKIADAARH